MNVLLSIKPEFANKILSGEKSYEFRKTKINHTSPTETVFMYSSSPVQQIVGYFTLKNQIEADPEELWSKYGSESGIEDRSRFMKYFSNSDKGYAIEIEDPWQFQDPVDPRIHFDEFRPPVSFQYIKSEPNREENLWTRLDGSQHSITTFLSD